MANIHEHEATYKSVISYNGVRCKVSKISEMFRGEIPQIYRKPNYVDYKLPENVDEVIKREKEELKRKKEKEKYKNVNWPRVIIESIVVFFVTVALSHIYEGNSSSDAIGIGIFFMCGFLFLRVCLSIDTGSKNYDEKTTTESNLSRYLKDIAAYEYWKNVTELSFWDSLDGHEFEKVVASLYQLQGYKTEVSPPGGDGGIDIILSKKGKRIAVQCKAHKSPVAPAVARDLYGTMKSNGYNEGIIVSKSGFTKGTIGYVIDLPIMLVDLNDLFSYTSSIGTTEEIIDKLSYNLYKGKKKDEIIQASQRKDDVLIKTKDSTINQRKEKEEIERQKKALAKEREEFEKEKAKFEKNRNQIIKGKLQVENVKKQKSKVTTSKPVIQLDDNGHLIKEYQSISEAGKAVGVSLKSIRETANGRQKHAGGYVWKFKD